MVTENEKEREPLSPTYNDGDGKGDANVTMDGTDADSPKVLFIKSGQEADGVDGAKALPAKVYIS